MYEICFHSNFLGLPEFSDINVSISASTSAGQGPFSEVSVIHIVTGGINYKYSLV